VFTASDDSRRLFVRGCAVWPRGWCAHVAAQAKTDCCTASIGDVGRLGCASEHKSPLVPTRDRAPGRQPARPFLGSLLNRWRSRWCARCPNSL